MSRTEDLQTRIRAEIRTVLDAVEAAFENGAPASRVMQMWYARDVITMGQGDPCALRGLDAQIAKAVEVLSHLGPNPRVRFRIDDPIAVWNDAAAVLIDTQVRPGTPGALTMAQSMLTVWRRDAAGWRIVREMYVVGNLLAPDEVPHG